MNLSRLFLNKIWPALNNVSNGGVQGPLLTRSYKAAVFKKTEEPLVITDMEHKKLKKTDVRIKVHFCSFNSVDAINLRKDDFHKHDKVFIPGYELSGKVLEVGKGVTADQVTVGEQVAALNLDHFGGFAEECIVDVNDCFRLPSNVDLKDASVLIYAHSTAVYTFSKLHTLHEKEVVAVAAGPAGLGLAAIDVAANMYKAKVIAVTNTKDISDLVRDRGAFNTILFGPKLQKDVFDITDNKGADVIFDAVGEPVMKTISSCVSTNGIIFHAAPVTYETIPAPPPNSLLSVVSLHALRRQNLNLYRTMINDTLELANDGILSAYIGSVHRFANINNAIDLISNRACTGKILIEMGN